MGPLLDLKTTDFYSYIYSSISRAFLYLKIGPKTGVRLILKASEMTC